MDDLCSTRDPVAVGVCEQLHDGRIHPYFARRSSHCAGTGPLSEAMTTEMIYRYSFAIVTFINSAIV